jgi:uncharacterized membrane protein
MGVKSMAKGNKRYYFFDELRGFFIILICLYHLMYDLAFIYPTRLGLSLYEKFGGYSILLASPFIIICGVSCFFSRSNLKRGLILIGISAVITIATLYFLPDSPIYFGILHLLGFSVLIFIVLKKVIMKTNSAVGIFISALLFALTFNLPRGFLGFGIYKLKIPEFLYNLKYLLPLGFFPKDFSTADYYPLIPFFFLFIIGAFIGKIVTNKKSLPLIEKNLIPPLSFIGRRTLIIYILHQPIFLLILYVIFKIF